MNSFETLFNGLNNQQKQVLGFCSIVPKDENDRINTKSSYGDIKKKLGDYNFKN